MESDSGATTKAQRSGTWSLKRAGAVVFLVATLAAVVWGYENQDPADPFAPRPWWAPLLSPLPHPHLGIMPVKPMGRRPGFVPRDLDLDPDTIAPEGATADGRRFVANRLAIRPGASIVAAIGADGRVLFSADGTKWTPVELPRTTAKTSKGTQATEPIAMLQEHTGSVSSVAFSPDGTRLATGSRDGTARLWDSAKGAEIIVLQGHKVDVTSVAFSPDGARLATGSDDGTARLWDTAKGAAIMVLQGHKDVVTSVAFSPDGHRLATGSGDGTARLWDTANGAEIMVLQGHKGAVYSVAFSPDGTRLATGSHDGTARLWDTAKGAEIMVLQGHKGFVFSVAFSPDGTRLATGSFDGTARLWDTSKGAEIMVLQGHKGTVYSAVFDPDGARLATGSSDGTARLWDTANGAEIKVLQWWETVAVTSVAFSPDGTRLATGSSDTIGRLWDVTPVAVSTASSPAPVALAADVTRGGLVWVVGRRGYVARLDGGESRAFATGIGTDLFAVHALDSQRVRVAGDKGVILASDDGGETWRRQPTDVEASIHALHVLASGRGWAAGDDGLILHHAGADKTGGEGTWKMLADMGEVRLTALHVQENRIAWAASEGTFGPATIFEATEADKGSSWRALPHYTAPWWFLLGLPAFVLAGFVNLRAWRPEPLPDLDSIVGQGTPDRPLGLGDRDALNLKPIALGLSRFLRNQDTEPPITIAIGGRWGTGKSSLMNMLKEDLYRHDCRPVWFNAWHHGREEQLLAALLESVRAQALPSWWTWPGVWFRARLFWRRVRKDDVNLLPLALLVVFVGGLVWLFVPWPQIESAMGIMGDWIETAASAVATLIPDALKLDLDARTLGAWGVPKARCRLAGVTFSLGSSISSSSGRPSTTSLNPTPTQCSTCRRSMPRMTKHGPMVTK